MEKQTTKLQVIQGGRLAAAHAALAHSRLVETVRHSRLRGDRLQTIAKRLGVGYNEVLEMVEEDAANQLRKARENAFREGMIAARFHPLPPCATQRRAA